MFPEGQEDGNLWVKDPPGGKTNPTTDPNFANKSKTYLDKYIKDNGPFVGILGYSQGSMFATYYMSTSLEFTKKLQFSILINGYLPDTHKGLLGIINKNKN